MVNIEKLNKYNNKAGTTWEEVANDIGELMEIFAVLSLKSRTKLLAHAYDLQLLSGVCDTGDKE